MMMLMVDVREMRMAVTQRLVSVFVRVGLRPVPLGAVLMLVMSVMHMGVRVREALVQVLVLVSFGELQPDTERHARGSKP